MENRKTTILDEEKLDELEREIDDARRKSGPASGIDKHKDEPHFVDTGTVETDKVDNDIAPPG